MGERVLVTLDGTVADANVPSLYADDIGALRQENRNRRVQHVSMLDQTRGAALRADSELGETEALIAVNDRHLVGAMAKRAVFEVVEDVRLHGGSGHAAAYRSTSASWAASAGKKAW